MSIRLLGCDTVRTDGTERALRHGLLVIAAVILFALTSCISPAINDEGYRGKVEHSAQSMTGIIGSAQLAAQLDLQGKMLGTVADQLISSAEQDAQSVLTSLGTVQPPDQGSIDLRTHAETVLQNAASQLSDLRIAQRRGDKAGMRQSLSQLSHSLADVQKLQDGDA